MRPQSNRAAKSLLFAGFKERMRQLLEAKGSNVSFLALTEEIYKGFPIRIQIFLTCVCISVRMDSFSECCLNPL